jgi:hypothetical protein
MDIEDCDDCGAPVGDAHASSCRQSPDYDPTPWCNGCGARRKSYCPCGPLADNE